MDQPKMDDTQSIYLPVSSGFPTVQETKPTMRGWLHAGILPIVIAGGVLLIVLGNGAAAKVAGSIFFAASFLLFGNSALYHRFNWNPKTKLILKRIDHANIFLLIAGSYTPITMLALPFSKGIWLLVAIWSMTIMGIGFRIFWIGAPRWLYVPIYIGMGWGAIVYVQDFMAANLSMMVLILAGGLAYTIGALVYGFKWPNPSKKHFGFHEIFHALTVAAFGCHWTAALLICLAPLSGSFAG
jgi:hemolysin III